MTPKQIKTLREKLNLSVRAFAAELGVAFSTVHLWEKGKTAPKGPYLQALNDLKDRISPPRKRPTLHAETKAIEHVGTGRFEPQIVVSERLADGRVEHRHFRLAGSFGTAAEAEAEAEKRLAAFMADQYGPEVKYGRIYMLQVDP